MAAKTETKKTKAKKTTTKKKTGKKPVKKVVIANSKKKATSTAKEAVSKKAVKLSVGGFKNKVKSAFGKDSSFLVNLMWVAITVVALLLVDFFVQYINNDFSAAKVNDGRITMSQLEDKVMDRMAEQILEEMVQEELIYQAAEEAGVEVSDEDVEKEYKRIAELYNGEEALEETLSASGYTKDSYMDSLKLELLANAILVEDPSEDELMAFFDENKEVYFAAQDAYGDDKETVSRTYIQVEFQGKVSDWLTQIQSDAVIVNNLNDKPEYGLFKATRDSFTNIYDLVTDKK
jgi:hypothetical protein